MQQTIDETDRRRTIQEQFNRKHSITPTSIEKKITLVFGEMAEINDTPADMVAETLARYESMDDIDAIIRNLEKKMKEAANELAFERAAELRDQIQAMKRLIVFEL
jgi:excinuclease ABC subunit B